MQPSYRTARARTEQETVLQFDLLYIFRDGLGGIAVQSNGSSLVALRMKPNGGFVDRAAESTRVSARAPVDCRAMNWACAGLGTVIASKTDTA